MFRSYGLLVLVAAIAICCRGSKERADPRQAAECARGFETALNAPAGERVGRVLVGCLRACPGLAELARDRSGASELGPSTSSGTDRGASPTGADPITVFASDCELFCSDAASTAWNLATAPERLAILSRECGLERYGLSGADAHGLSVGWLALHKIFGWLDKQRASMSDTARAGFEKAAFLLPVPARVPGLYQLADARFSRPVDSSLVVTVTGESIRISASPIARFTASGPRLLAKPFPGELLRSAVEQIGELVGDAAGQAGAVPVPLVLIDGSMPASRVAEVGADLGQPRIALGVSGYSARSHPIALEIIGSPGSAAPLFELAADEWRIVGVEDEAQIPFGPAGRARLISQLRALSVQRAPQNKIELALISGAKVSDLAAMLDVVAETKFAVALLQARRPGAK